MCVCVLAKMHSEHEGVCVYVCVCVWGGGRQGGGVWSVVNGAWTAVMGPELQRKFSR